MASQDARLSKFEADFKQQHCKMANKIDTVLKAVNDRIVGALLSDTVKNPKLNVNSTSPVLSVRPILDIHLGEIKSCCGYETKNKGASAVVGDVRRRVEAKAKLVGSATLDDKVIVTLSRLKYRRVPTAEVAELPLLKSLHC
uniref:Uncharacterized protein n=1 Tax=Tanacetum cinerariifolium TaxID=118510 RepID=A0A6L2N385_TANCI|nr:hypothetical protein [Tanacetum cinerariifolium]